MKIYKFTQKIIFLCFFTFGISQKKFTVVLDAGHGGSDLGANRYYEGLGKVVEKNITLSVTLLLGRMLEKNKDYKVIYTRKVDEYPSLTARTKLANRSKADLFVSIHCNASSRTEAHGTETFVQGPNQNKTNLEVAKAENSVIYLDEKDRETFASYDPSSPESLIALKIQQSKYLESSLLFGGMVEENFSGKDQRFSRGVKQDNFHVLRMNVMPSVLIEIGFISNYNDAKYLMSSSGQQQIAESLYNAIVSYKKKIDRNIIPLEPSEPGEVPLKNDFRILLFGSATLYHEGDPMLKGLKYILPIKEGTIYKYYYSTTNLASIRDQNLKTAKDAGFISAYPVGFVPNQGLASGYYTLEIIISKTPLPKDSDYFRILGELDREQINGMYHYTYGETKTLEEIIKLQKEIKEKGIEKTVIKRILK